MEKDGKVYQAVFTSNTLPTRKNTRQIQRCRSTTLTNPTHNQHFIYSDEESQSQSQSQSQPRSQNQQSQFHSDQLDLLQVIDPAVQAASTLTHIQNSLLIPPIINRFGTPIIQLQTALSIHPDSPPDSPTTHSPPSNSQNNLNQQPTEDQDAQVQEPINHLDQHLISILAPPLKKSKIKSFFNPHLIRRHIQGIVAFVITPTGFIFTVYGFLVVFWGAALTLILLGWLKFKSNHQYRIWVEICSQILNGLFTIPGLGLLPSRLIDWWNISIILHYARVIWKRKGRKNLEDPNELLPQPEPNQEQKEPDSRKVEVKEETRTEDKTTPNRVEETSSDAEHEHVQEHEHRSLKNSPGARNEPQSEPQHDQEVAQENRSSFVDVWKDDQELVLDDPEIVRLRTAQEKLCRSQTWYRPHSSATHYAFPIKWAVLIMLLNLGNSIFQLGLCVVMWGLRYSTRPAWTTATFMALSFSCGLASALLIWRIGVKTSKSQKVLKEVKQALKPTKKDKLKNPHQRQQSNQRKSLQVMTRIKEHISTPKKNQHAPNSVSEDPRRRSSSSSSGVVDQRGVDNTNQLLLPPPDIPSDPITLPSSSSSSSSSVVGHHHLDVDHSNHLFLPPPDLPSEPITLPHSSSSFCIRVDSPVHDSHLHLDLVDHPSS